jgi:glutathione peroxidase
MGYRSLIIGSLIIMGIVAIISKALTSGKKRTVTGSIYDFSVKTLQGRPVSLSEFRGKYMLIVNTASKCGYTPQYADLEKLHEEFGQKVAVLGFPANNFLWQEPGSDKEIEQFCEVNYGVKFPMFEKISVRGSDKAPLYQWLEAKTGETPSWNFCKYLVNPAGEVISFYPPGVTPMDKKIMDQINRNAE